jgi:beta-lactam-binding protein with PASTA domain
MKKVLGLVAVMALLISLGAVGLGTALGGDNAATAVRVPRVTGLRLDTAELRLMARGLRYKEHGGGFFGIVVRHNWQVCFQTPSGGAHVSRGTRVQLFVSRPGQC